MHACRESRAYLGGAGGYTKAFTGGSEPNYTWVHFAIDTIHPGEDEINLEDVLALKYKRIVRLFHGRPEVLSLFFDYGNGLPKAVKGSNVKHLTLLETETVHLTEKSTG